MNVSGAGYHDNTEICNEYPYQSNRAQVIPGDEEMGQDRDPDRGRNNQHASVARRRVRDAKIQKDDLDHEQYRQPN
jgi:hypothetical protein